MPSVVSNQGVVLCGLKRSIRAWKMLATSKWKLWLTVLDMPCFRYEDCALPSAIVLCPYINLVFDILLWLDHRLYINLVKMLSLFNESWRHIVEISRGVRSYARENNYRRRAVLSLRLYSSYYFSCFVLDGNSYEERFMDIDTFCVASWKTLYFL